MYENDPERQRFDTAMMTEGEVKLQVTANIHKTLQELWHVVGTYNVMISVFPPQDDYDSIPLEETFTGSKRNICVKEQKLDEYAHITYYRPDNYVTKPTS